MKEKIQIPEGLLKARALVVAVTKGDALFITELMLGDGGVLGSAPGDVRRWPLSAWDTEDGRPKFEAAVGALGATPRIEDAVKISYGAKVLYEKEARDGAA